MSIELQTTTSLHSISTSTLLDAGATGMFVNPAFAQKHKLETCPLPNPVPVHNVDGTPNENGSIMEEVEVILQYGQQMEKAHLAVTNLRQQTVIIGHSWLTHHNPEVDWAHQSVKGGQTEAWWRTMDQNPEMRFMPHSSPLSGQNTTLGLQIPHCSGWPRKHRRLREADPLRTWCQPNTMTSEMSSPRKPLMSSHHGRHGITPLISHLGLNSLTPGCSPCTLQHRRSVTTSSGRTIQMATSIHPSPPWEPLCSLSRRRMVHFASYRTIRS